MQGCLNPGRHLWIFVLRFTHLTFDMAIKFLEDLWTSALEGKFRFLAWMLPYLSLRLPYLIIRYVLVATFPS
jgi:hypothetical protein